MPIVEPGGRRLHITPSMIVAGLVALVVIAFIGYIGFQLLRFAEVTPLSITNPPDHFSRIDAESVALAGTSSPTARVHIAGPGDQTYDVTAHDDGTWTQEVRLGRGQNDFTIRAYPVAGTPSDPVTITINVPLPSQSPGSSATPSAGPPITLELSLTSPSDGFVSTDGVVIVSGTTTGSRINVTTSYLGTPDSTPAPSGSPTPSPMPSGSPGPTATPAPIGPGGDIALGIGGAFSQTFNFDPGRWQLTIVSHATDQTPVARQVTIVVRAPGPVTQHLQLTIENSATFVRVLADGARVENGQLSVGSTHEYTATQQFCVRAGNAGSVHLVLDAQDLGLLGADGEQGSWIVKSGIAPVRAPRPC
jgi:hypothetical protein